MRIRLKNELLWVNLLSLLLIGAITLFPGFGLRIVLGLPFLLFLPGYVLLALLFPKRDALDGIERVALSFGVSLAVVALLGLAMNYTPWGITLYPILLSITGFVLVVSVLAWYRQRRLPEASRLTIDFTFNPPAWKSLHPGQRVLWVLLSLSIVTLLGAVVFVMAVPKPQEQFTEFYLLGAQGQAADYPRELAVGQEATVIVGIINHEQSRASYTVEVRLDGAGLRNVGPVVLENGGTWEQPVGFTPPSPGEQQKLEFQLYKDGQPYMQPLYLWVNVKATK